MMIILKRRRIKTRAKIMIGLLIILCLLVVGFVGFKRRQSRRLHSQQLLAINNLVQRYPLIQNSDSDQSFIETHRIDKARCSKTSVEESRLKAQSSKTGIPLIIHTIYKNSRIPRQYFFNLFRCQHINPEFEFLLWTDDAARRFIQSISSEHLKFYNTYPFDLQRSDVLRYFFLYHIGGFYMDMDVDCIKPIRPLLDKHECFLDREKEIQSQILYDRPYIAMNSGMGCRPKHPFFKMVLDALPEIKAKHPYSVLESTGPIFITEMFHNYASTNDGSEHKVRVLPSAVLSPYLDPSVYFLPRLKQICSDEKALKPFKWVQIGCETLAKHHFIDFVSKKDVKMIINIHTFMHLGRLGGKQQISSYVDLCKVKNPPITVL